MSGQEKRWRSDEDLPGVVFEDTGAPVDGSRLAAAKQRLQDVSSKVHEGEEKKSKPGYKRRVNTYFTSEGEAIVCKTAVDELLYAAQHGNGDPQNIAWSVYDKYVEFMGGHHDALGKREAWAAIFSLVTFLSFILISVLSKQVGGGTVPDPHLMDTLAYIQAETDYLAHSVCLPLLGLGFPFAGFTVGGLGVCWTLLKDMDDVSIRHERARQAEVMEDVPVLVNKLLASAGKEPLRPRAAKRAAKRFGDKYAAILWGEQEINRQQAIVDAASRRG